MPQVYDMLARMKSRIQVARAISYEASRLVDQRRMLEHQIETKAARCRSEARG